MMEQPAAPNVRLGEWISEGWDLFTKQWQTWVLIVLTFVVISVVVMIPGAMLAELVDAGREDAEGPSAAGMLLSFLGNILSLIISNFLLAGGFRAAFKQLRGEQISVGDLFSASDVFMWLVPAQLLISLITTIGIVLCVVPGLIANGLLFFSVPLIVAAGLGPFEAMQRSFETTKQNILMFTLFPIVIGFLAAIGLLGCGIGVLATAPLYFTITAVAYRDIFGLEGVRPSFAAPQLPNYAPQAYNQQSWANQPPQSYPPPASGNPPAWGNPAPPVNPPRPASPYNQPQAPPPMISPRQFPPQPQQPPGQPRPFAPPPPPAGGEPLPPTQVMPAPGAPPSEPASGLTADQKTCPHCRATLQRAARFCNYCGKPLSQ
jgi:hypothetical protein